MIKALMRVIRENCNTGCYIEDPRSVPFNVDDVYAASGGTPHGWYVKISIVFNLLLSVHNT
jgi:hypothetical protein